MKKWIISINVLVSSFAFTQISTPNDCIDALRLCDATQSIYFTSLGPGVIDDANGALGLACHAQNSANTYEDDTTFFKFTPNQTGQFGFYITPEIAEDWEWILFGPNPNCSDLNNAPYLACSTFTPGTTVGAITGIGEHPTQAGGSSLQGIHDWVTVQAGDTYILMIMPFGTTGQNASITFQGSLVDNNPNLFDHPDCTVGIQEFNRFEFSMAPNPARHQILLTSDTHITHYTIHTLQGKLVQENSYDHTAIAVDTLDTGVYLVTVMNQLGHIEVKKLVVRHE